jgi:type III secretion protein W
MTQDPLSIAAQKIAQTQTSSPQTQTKASFPVSQEISSDSFEDQCLDPGGSLFSIRRFESLDQLRRKEAKKTDTAERKEEKEEQEVQEVQAIEEIAQQYDREQQEFHFSDLIRLRARILPTDDPEQILKKVLQSYRDLTLADEALNFLIDTTAGSLQQSVRKAKQQLNLRFGREIRAGRNIQEAIFSFLHEELGSPSELRDLYREITGNPRTPQKLFEELSKTYVFERLKPVIRFLLHSLGNDLKAKGPSISKAQLHRLMTDVSSLQAILGVYLYFQSRMRNLEASFDKEGFKPSTPITFELLAKLFINFLQDRYPSAQKVLQLASSLGILEELLIQILVFNHMRDATRFISPRFFRNEQHRQEVLSSFIEALEELEEQLEEKEEDDDDKKDKREKKKKG